MSDDLNIGMAAGIGAAQAAAQSKATHAATMAAKDGQLHQLEKMIIVKRWQAYAAWLKMGLKSHITEKKIVITELTRIDPENDVAKKAQNKDYSSEVFSTLQGDPAQQQRYVQLATEEIERVVS
jgi:hypothetical protein